MDTKVQKLLLIRGIFIIALCVIANDASAQNTITTPAKQAIVIDYDTGQVLFKKNPDEKMPTSSMSKTLTAIVVFDALKSKKLSLNDTFRVSEKAWQKGGSKMFVGLNSDVSVKDLLLGVIVQSGNDATIVLAEGMSGSEDAFATALNKKAAQLGMSNSNFVNASGWPDDNHYSTARDLAKMTRAMIRDYPKYYKYFSEKSFDYNDISQANRNPLLYQNIGADGVKTGHTEAGGYGLIGSAKQDGRRVIIVLNGLVSNEDRAKESEKVMRWALSSFKNINIPVGEIAIPAVDVAYGAKPNITPILKDDARLTIAKMIDMDDIQTVLNVRAPLRAPIKMGDKIGDLVIQSDDMILKKQPVFAAQTIPESGFFKRTFQKASYFLDEKLNDDNG